MKAVESEGASVQEAVERALLLLGVEADEANVVVLREAEANGGSSTARVRVEIRSPQDAALSADTGIAGAAESEPVSAAEGAVEPPSPKPSKTRSTRGKAPADRKSREEPVDVSGETIADVEDAGPGAAVSHDQEVPLTDEEGERADKAGDFLEDLFEILDLDCYVEVAADLVDGKILIDIGGPDTSVIIGRKGAMLDAVEFVVNRAIDNIDGGGTRIALDAAGYRERRSEKLRELAVQQAKRVSQTSRSVALEPMTARERRIIHIALRENPNVSTRSEGEGTDRFVIIEPTRGTQNG